MEPISNPGDVRVNKADDIGDGRLHRVLRVKQQLNPANKVIKEVNLPDLALGAKVVLQGSAELSLVEHAHVDCSIE